MSESFQILTPTLLRNAREHSELTEAEAANAPALSVQDYRRLEAQPAPAQQEVVENFLLADTPNRGQLFRDFLTQLKKDPNPTSAE